ncbi:MAG: tail fiber domain-containing protein [Candidatus Gastranaerophilales bacterium]|nr:tail fiber domain-containing protein [Candidatus Gastranaerophilales bacterium]
MYKNKSAVTLIETLISLTIVGIALVALLPVVTVKKASTVTDYGNIYWDNSKKFNDIAKTPYLCPATNIPAPQIVSIGGGNQNAILQNGIVNPGSPAQNTNFTIYNQGLGNSENFPLSVTNLLTWNDSTIRSLSANSLFIGSEQHNIQAWDFASSAMNNHIGYKNNLYLNADGANTFILVQNTDTDQELHLANDERYYSLEPIEAKIYYDDAHSLSANTDITSSLSTIRLENNEYMHLSTPTVGGSTFMHIGIGKNAVKTYSQESDIIAIANKRNAADKIFSSDCGISGGAGVTGEPCKRTDLVIGSRYNGEDINHYNVPEDWVIHHYPAVAPATGMFTINAPTVSFPSITVAKVVLPSDRRLKTILSQYKKGLKELLKINPVEFVYKKDEKKEHHIGVIAQDLRKVFPEAVEQNPQTGYFMVGTEPIFYAMINAIKELHLKNQELKKQNDELEQKVIKLRKIRDELKASQGGVL